MKKINLNVLVGMLLLVIGCLAIINALDVGVEFTSQHYSLIVWSFVTLLGVVVMINDKNVSIFSLVLMFVGLWNVLKLLGFMTTSMFALFWPILLILIGVKLIFPAKMFNKIPVKKQDGVNVPVYNGIFGGVEERLVIKDFKGLSANAIFGAVELDLTNIEIEEDVKIDITAIFGGIDLKLPETYNVVVTNSLAIFGGMENKFKGNYDKSKKTIYINSKFLFGGGDIK